jgi:endogenous inhibitor of DNA gyrase (YacG/DUF329 family)
MARQYRYQYKCPMCQKPYAKKSAWVQHIADHYAKESQPK